MMKTIKTLVTSLLMAAFVAAPLAGFAADDKAPKKNAKAKPYPLKNCIVSDEKLGSMGEAYVFVHEGQEYKLCCKGCLKDFKKETAKFQKKLETEQKKQAANK